LKKGFIDILLGLQWGDEGKGKIIDVLAPAYNVIARFQGGPNAGHSLVFEGKKFVLHTIPSGIFREECLNLIGNGVVIDPVTLRREIEMIEATGIQVKNKLLISRKAHLITPTHKVLDAGSEQAKGKNKIGSTLRGIGPAYMDKTGRNGLRVGDIESKDFKEKFEFLSQKHWHLIQGMGYNPDKIPSADEWFEAIEFLSNLRIVDAEYFLHEELMRGSHILAEGAQGTLLDIDFGTYPYVTSSTTIAAGACSGLGIPPTSVRKIFGVFKAYCTRVGQGPFPTELSDQSAKILRDKGHEYGATTGRPRRCGWLDLPALKFAILINGVTDLMIMKTDVLCEFPEIWAAISYEIKGQTLHGFPFHLEDDSIKPVYKVFEGWPSFNQNSPEMPPQLEVYLQYIEKYCEIPISLISIGPDRKQTVIRRELVNIDEV